MSGFDSGWTEAGNALFPDGLLLIEYFASPSLDTNQTLVTACGNSGPSGPTQDMCAAAQLSSDGLGVKSTVDADGVQEIKVGKAKKSRRKEKREENLCCCVSTHSYALSILLFFFSSSWNLSRFHKQDTISLKLSEPAAATDG